MPRIYTSESDAVDFCKRHFPSEKKALELYGDLGDGPDDRGNCFSYDDDHPPYDDGREYRCEVCNKILTDNDN